MKIKYYQWVQMFTVPMYQRRGQAWMNHLATHNLAMYRWVTVKTDNLDPFYHDDRVPAFLSFVEREWDNF